eukprot:scaffold26_cov158-Amphora_coffeaeformis.AAC.1
MVVPYTIISVGRKCSVVKYTHACLVRYNTIAPRYLFLEEGCSNTVGVSWQPYPIISGDARFPLYGWKSVSYPAFLYALPLATRFVVVVVVTSTRCIGR